MRGEEIKLKIKLFLCSQKKGALFSPNQLHSKLSGWHDPYRTIRPYLEELNGVRCNDEKRIVITNKGWAYIDDPVQDEELLAETECELPINFKKWLEDGLRTFAKDFNLPSPDLIFDEGMGIKPLSEILRKRLCKQAEL